MGFFRVGKNKEKKEETYQGRKQELCTQTVWGLNVFNRKPFLTRENARNIPSTSWIDLCTLYFSTILFYDLNGDVVRGVLQFCDLICNHPCSELLIFPSKRLFSKLYHRKNSTQNRVHIFHPIRKYKHNFQRRFL